jgi:hypothetical protein
VTVLRSKGQQGHMPDGMPAEMISYRFFAQSYGWTPEQVRSLSLEEFDWLPLVETAFGEASRQEQAAQERMQRRKAQ